MATYVVVADFPGYLLGLNATVDTIDNLWDTTTVRKATQATFVNVNGSTYGFDVKVEWEYNSVGPSTSVWAIHQNTMQFDTSVIGVGELVVNADIRLVQRTAFTAYTTWSLEYRERSWTGTPVVTDWIPGDQFFGNPVGTLEITAGGLGGAIHSMPLLPGFINRTGTTQGVLVPSLQSSSTDPSGPQNRSWGAAFRSDGELSPPRLIVHTVKPSTLNRVHDAAVQLSDGSTVYLESDGAAIPTVALKKVTTAGVVTEIGNIYDGTAIPKGTGLQVATLVADSSDNIYLIGAADSSSIYSLQIKKYVDGGTGEYALDSSASYMLDEGEMNNLAATFCDAGAGLAGEGRILIAGFKQSGESFYQVVECSDISLSLGGITPWVTGAPSLDKSYSLVDGLEPAGLKFSPDGLKAYVADYEWVIQYTLSVGWDLTTGVYNSRLDLSAQETDISGLAFNDTGTKIYVIGTASDAVHQYSLSTAWDISSTVTFESSYSVADKDTTPVSVTFSDSGNRMFVGGFDTKNVFSYTLASPWNISTGVVYESFYYVGNEESGLNEVTFGNNGMKMYVIGWRTYSVHQYDLSVAWDITTATYPRNAFSVVFQDGTPTDLAFNDTGTKLYVTGSISDSVHQYGLSTAWDISSTVTFESSYSVADKDTDPSGLTFNNDGTKLYVIGTGSDQVHQYSLSTAWDIGSTVTFQSSYSVAAQELLPQGLAFNDTGTKLYVIGSSSDAVHQYSLSTAWDIGSTVTFQSSYSVATQETYPQGLAFNDTGTKLYVIGYGSGAAHQYSLSIAWDLGSTVTFQSSFYVTAKETTPTDLAFNDTGTKLYVIGSTSDSVHQYGLSTAWDIGSTVTFQSSYNVEAKETAPGGLAFNSTGTKLYVTGGISDSVHQYGLSTAWDIGSTVTFESSYSVAAKETNPAGLAFNSTGTKMHVIGGISKSVHQYSLSTAWDIGSTVRFQSSYSVSSKETYPLGLAFNSTGTKLYVTGDMSASVHQYSLFAAWEFYDESTTTFTNDAYSVINDFWGPYALTLSPDGTNMFVGGDSYTSGSLGSIYKYPLGVAWDVTSATYLGDYLDTSPTEASPQCLAFNDTGTKIYVIGTASDAVHQYGLSIAWDVGSTVTYESSYSVATQEASPRGLAFNSTGTKLYVIGSTSDAVHQYSLSTAWNIGSTVTFESSYSVATQDTNPFGLIFDSTGTRLYVIGYSSALVHQYSLSTAWDIGSTVTFQSSYSVATQETYPQGLAFNDTGTKLYVIGSSSDAVHQYSLSTAWDIGSTVTLESGHSVAAQETDPSGLTFNDTGTKLYVIGGSSESVHQYDLHQFYYDEHPSWLVSSSLYRNQSGTGLSLATDVFGGTRVGAFAWSNNALTSTSGTVTYQTRAATLTVGATITNVSVDFWSEFNNQIFMFDPNGVRAKVVGVGANSFIGVFNSSSSSTGLVFKGIHAGSQNWLPSDTDSFFDAVYDPGSGAVWAYYWNPADNTKLMRVPFYPATVGIGTAELVTTLPAIGGSYNFIRTVKHLRDPLYIEVHYNETGPE